MSPQSSKQNDALNIPETGLEKDDERECGFVMVEVELSPNSVALVRKRTIPTERPPPVGEVSANFCG